MNDDGDSEPPQDLWSSILDSVSSTRAIPSKSVLLLGEPRTGKSTIAAGLLQREVDSLSSSDADFAIGYDWADVKDDAEEDMLARLSVLTVPSASPAHLALVPHFIPTKSALPHALIMILLDWTKPWAFIEQLQQWLDWVDKWAKGDGSRDMEIIREESRERLQAHLQHYTEPSAEPTAALPLTAAATMLPLGPGTLTHNPAGVPIVVLCTKADLIDDSSDGLVPGPSGMGGMIKGKGPEWEERTDAVMQVLRTICLKYGAGLFYTSQQPATLKVLRQYALHLLFAPPAPNAGADAPTVRTNPFPFTHKPNTLDRDRILVPAGWDSWGKIAVLRDGFEAVVWGDAWENDQDVAEPQPNGIRAMFRDLVGPDRSIKPPPLPELIQPTPEQNFLAKHHEALSKDPERDPRAQFRAQQPATASSGSLHGAAADGPAGVVGPMAPSSFSLVNVQRALTEMETASEPSVAPHARTRPGGASGPSRREKGAGSTSSSANPLAAVLPGLAGRAPGGGIATSPTGGRGGGGDMGTQQHEVLQNFFQSLLVSKNRGGGATGAGAPTSPGGVPAGSSSNRPATTGGPQAGTSPTTNGPPRAQTPPSPPSPPAVDSDGDGKDDTNEI
ncbi:DLIC-domain-containing protein [Auriculariales sp. MPI-PUGE-AT-0066]|nr:DLIC-domain-containing protein [Auriculariales sp. MPI-PUGE-AT-0066]